MYQKIEIRNNAKIMATSKISASYSADIPCVPLYEAYFQKMASLILFSEIEVFNGVEQYWIGFRFSFIISIAVFD